MSQLQDYEAVLLDIEGTTTPIHFVYEVLFPYAQRELKNYLEQHWNDPNVREDIEELTEQFAKQPRDDKGQPLRKGEDQSTVEAFKSEVIERIEGAMENDEKHPPLKSLQGRIWQRGYKEGKLEAPVYDDVPQALEAWKQVDIPVYIYSSGSVAAQKLLFEHSDQGDLRPYLAGYFDTHTGHKKEAKSYRTISDEIEVSRDAILFVTDSREEAEAAREAGLTVAISKRPGNPDIKAHDFPTVESFDALYLSG